MALLDLILGAQGGGQLQQLAARFGVSETQARDAMAHLLPALSQGLKRSAGAPGGLDALLSALQSGGHQRYLDRPEELTRPETIDEGNNILGHILGSKDVSRRVAARAAEQTGMDTGVLKQMLPMVAALAMGALSKQNSAAGGALSERLNGGGSATGGGSSLLALLDQDQDGSVVDDLLGMAKKLF